MYPVDDDFFFLFLGEVSGHGLEVAVSGKEYVGVCVFVFGGCLVDAVQHDEVGHVFFGAGVGCLYDGAGGFPDRILGSSWFMGVWEKSPNTRISVRLKLASSSLRQADIWGLIPYRFW